ncbi:MAG: hypothetical protein B1H11_07380 [Desulfobacteraceae bacterium 4484_190.1]|nr:MAG: hypothetical protein B1H11_07380 [Desulfobacteraceae bacterium 4484_190.1]
MTARYKKRTYYLKPKIHKRRICRRPACGGKSKAARAQTYYDQVLATQIVLVSLGLPTFRAGPRDKIGAPEG